MKHNLTRRQFLIIAATLGLTEACNLVQSATPTPHLSTSIPPSPTRFSNTSSPAATVTSTATIGPTDTATATPVEEIPTETPTAVETVTPTLDVPPTPTPYPPGPPSKLGLFITRLDSTVMTLIEVGQPPLVKTLEIDPNFATGVKAAAPGTILVGRILLGQINLDDDPLPLARQFVDELLPLATERRRLAAFDAWEAYNEPVADTSDKMKRLADFEAERTRLLAQEGVRSVVGNFATGHPPLELWSDFAPALAAIKEHNGYLGLHEYSAPIMQFGYGALQLNDGPDEGDEGWLTVRYRKAYRQHLSALGYGDLPLLITECGVDGLVSGRPGPAEARGWQDFIPTWQASGLRDDPPGVYMDQLIWYDGELQKDDYVKGAAIFVAGASPGWESYDILGRPAELLQQYLEVHPQR